MQEHNANVQRIAAAFVGGIRQNSDRCKILKTEELSALPKELPPVIKPDDQYLLQAQLSVQGAVLVTTGQPLAEAVQRAGLPRMSREEFLAAYC